MHNVSAYRLKVRKKKKSCLGKGGGKHLQCTYFIKHVSGPKTGIWASKPIPTTP